MFIIVAPIFMVIMIGYLFGRKYAQSTAADKLINDYVLYVALPALLFLAIARADSSDLNQPGFIFATLSGIVVVYIIASFIAKAQRIDLPQSAILSMGASYGTTGYMGVPILLAVFGESAALPAAIATILHNIPAMMAVIISHDLCSATANGTRLSARQSLFKALRVTLTNPLTLSVIAGMIFVIFDLPLPTFLVSFCHFLGNAAGPTALFALGLGLARCHLWQQINPGVLRLIAPMVLLKLMIQPAITLLVAMLVFGLRSDNIWLIAAVVMAAQPIGAGVYVFASKYGSNQQVVSLAIIISLLMALFTLPLILQLFAGDTANLPLVGGLAL